MTFDRPAVLLLGDTLSVGGTENQFVEVACRLDRSKWDLQVGCLRAEGPLRDRLDAAGIDAWSCGPGSFRSPRLISSVVQLRRRLRMSHVRIVHCFDHYSDVLGVLAARLAGTPVILASQRDMGDVRSGLRAVMHRLALRGATRVVVNADAIRLRLIRDRVVAADRIEFVPNGIDLDRFPPREDSERPREIVVGTVANLRPEKGLEDLLHSAAVVRRRVPSARFEIWGDGALRERLGAVATALGLQEAVRFAGRTASVAEVLRDLSVFVFPPTRNEGLSNSLLEAMAVGVPVVATRVGGNAELVDGERTGLLVAPGDRQALADGIVRLIDDPELARDMAAAGRDRVRATFGMERMIARIEGVYERALTPVGA